MKTTKILPVTHVCLFDVDTPEKNTTIEVPILLDGAGRDVFIMRLIQMIEGCVQQGDRVMLTLLNEKLLGFTSGFKGESAPEAHVTLSFRFGEYRLHRRHGSFFIEHEDTTMFNLLPMMLEERRVAKWVAPASGRYCHDYGTFVIFNDAMLR